MAQEKEVGMVQQMRFEVRAVARAMAKGMVRRTAKERRMVKAMDAET